MTSKGPIPNDPIEAYHAVRDGSLKYAMYCYCPTSDNIAVKETGLYDPKASDEAAWEAFLDRLQTDECRYIVYNFVYPGIQDGKEATKKKLLYILWWVIFLILIIFRGSVVTVADSCRAPEGSHVRDKMNLSHHGKRFRDMFGQFDDESHSTFKEWITYPEGV